MAEYSLHFDLDHLPIQTMISKAAEFGGTGEELEYRLQGRRLPRAREQSMFEISSTAIDRTHLRGVLFIHSLSEGASFTSVISKALLDGHEEHRLDLNELNFLLSSFGLISLFRRILRPSSFFSTSTSSIRSRHDSPAL